MSSITDPARLAALDETELLDRPSLVGLDRYARIAQAALGVPVALVSLVDDHRQFFTSQVGLGELIASARATPLSHSFCQHVVTSEAPLIVSDARVDARVAGNPAIRELGVIAYAGMPIRTGDGYVLGSFCAIASEPKIWSKRELDVLADLALAVSAEVDLHRRAVRAEQSRQHLVGAIDALEALQHDGAQSSRQATHDLRTPLQVIDLGVQHLQNHATIIDRPELRRLVGMIKRNVDLATALVSGLHDTANLPIAREPLDLGVLVATACADLQHRNQAIEITIDRDPSCALVVSGGAGELRRCIDNLVTNAQRFARAHIVVRLRVEAGLAVALVEDDGPGLPTATDYARSWTSQARFHQLEGKSGTGLGLSGVRAIIEANRGQVRAGRSSLGGAGFGFALPLA